ncbi:MAG: helix-turn-helix domain-containing protein [Bacteroidales bacterium]|nr:helix-turn-helix domain-containing protein [Bacteroidales bacterium]
MAQKNYVNIDLFHDSRINWVTPYVTLDRDLLLADNIDRELHPNEYPPLADNKFPRKLVHHLLVTIYRGEIELMANLEKITVKAGEVLSLAEGTIGELISLSDDCQIAMMYFNTDLWPVYNIKSEYLTMFNAFFVSNMVVKPSDKVLNEFKFCYSKIKEILSDNEFLFKREAVVGYLQVLLANACQWISSQPNNKETEGSDNAQRIFKQFLFLVSKNFLNERSLAFYAEKMCISVKYLSQTVAKASGRVAIDWIKDYVILEAKAMLKSKKYNVQQVSDNLKFANPSFFGKYFKSATGITPRKYMLD